MSYEEFLRQIGKAGLKLHEFATLMDMSHVSISNYRKKGEVPRHLAMIAALLGEMAERGVDYRAVLAKLDLTPKRTREPVAPPGGGDADG
ncbi:MAG: XRE family transcriptional regulator [Burkholderiaceae bacterium]|nr:XRE family transcriptional regulator [Burkholderiaceae bacterium]